VTQTGWVRSGSSFASSSDLRAFFGLGQAASVDRIEVRWPTGLTETFPAAPANQVLTLTEGTGSPIMSAVSPAVARPEGNR
jgi:hypothetical protein